MLKYLRGGLAIAALVMVAGSANADSLTGDVESVDMTKATIVVGGVTFAMSPQNTVGTKISEIEEGDVVSVFYSSSGKSQTNFNAMIVTKQMK